MKLSSVLILISLNVLGISGDDMSIEAISKGHAKIIETTPNIRSSIKKDGGPSLVVDNTQGGGFLSRGHNIVVFDENTGAVTDQKCYDTWAAEDAPLKGFLDSIPEGRIIAVVVDDSGLYSPQSTAVFQRWGPAGCAANPLQSRQPFIFIGVASDTINPSWQYCATGEAETEISVTVTVPLTTATPTIGIVGATCNSESDCKEELVCTEAKCSRDCNAFVIDEFLRGCSAEWNSDQIDIAANARRSATNRKNITSNAGSISVNSGDILTNKGDIGTNKGDIDARVTKIDYGNDMNAPETGVNPRIAARVTKNEYNDDMNTAVTGVNPRINARVTKNTYNEDMDGVDGVKARIDARVTKTAYENDMDTAVTGVNPRIAARVTKNEYNDDMNLPQTGVNPRIDARVTKNTYNTDMGVLTSKYNDIVANISDLYGKFRRYEAAHAPFGNFEAENLNLHSYDSMGYKNNNNMQDILIICLLVLNVAIMVAFCIKYNKDRSSKYNKVTTYSSAIDDENVQFKN